MTTAYIGLGANLGNAESTLEAAIAAITNLPNCDFSARSSFYRSVPVDAGGDDYTNAVIQIETILAPQILLHHLHEIEQQYGRVRSYRNAPRTLDCDLLLYGHETSNTPTLILPHPRLHQRAFVLLPLLEIAPNCVLPNLGRAAQFLPHVAQQKIQKV